MPAQDFDPNELYPSKWMNANEIADGEKRPYKIADMELLPFKDDSGNPIQKLVLHSAFRTDKPFILNKGLFKQIADLLGTKTSQWVGHTILLGSAMQMSYGKPMRQIYIAGVDGDTTAPVAQAANGATQSPMSQLRARVEAETGEPCTPKQILIVLEAEGYEKSAPVAADVTRCAEMLCNYLAANKYQMPSLVIDQPRPGQTTNGHDQGAHAREIANLPNGAPLPNARRAPVAAAYPNDTDDTDPYADN